MVRLSVDRVPRPNSRTERPRKPKIGRMEAHHTSNSWTYIEVESSKVEITRPVNAVPENAPYAGRGNYNFLKLTFYNTADHNEWYHHRSKILGFKIF